MNSGSLKNTLKAVRNLKKGSKQSPRAIKSVTSPSLGAAKIDPKLSNIASEKDLGNPKLHKSYLDFQSLIWGSILSSIWIPKLQKFPPRASNKHTQMN